MTFAQSELSSLKKRRETSTTDQQLGSDRPGTSLTAENIDTVNDLALRHEGASGARSPGKLVFRGGQYGTHHKDIRQKTMKPRAQELTGSNKASLIKQ